MTRHPPLATLYPQFLRDLWDSPANQGLDSRTIASRSGKKVGWCCSKCGFRWQAPPTSIIRAWSKGRSGCRRCAGQIPSSDRNFATAHPNVAAEWHPTKNGPLRPEQITPSSNTKFWWQCAANSSHEWHETADKRGRGYGCPFCSGRRVHESNSLQVLNPELAAQWHPTKNGKLLPSQVTSSSHQDVWWFCPANEKHEWQRTPNRRSRGDGCPICAGRQVDDTNSLATINPELAAEWHPTRNGSLTPADVTRGSNRRVWWQCPWGHVWEAPVTRRSYGIGCPRCTNQTSRPELRLLAELRPIFTDIQHRVRVDGIECDLLIPSLSIAIMVDGRYYHEGKERNDEHFTEHLEQLGYEVLRLRGRGLREIGTCLFYDESTGIRFENFIALLRILCSGNPAAMENVACQQYLERQAFARESDFLELVSQIPGPGPGKALRDVAPDVAEMWHPTLNGRLTPELVSPGSNLKVFWLCPNGHEYSGIIFDRVKGIGCPYCAGQKVSNDNALGTLNPDLAAEWHPTRNGSLTPADVTANSKKRVWWQCSKIQSHEWQATIQNRHGRNSGCPYCAGKKVDHYNSLAAGNPQLAAEWHPTKNRTLTPDQVTASSNRKVWWQCPCDASHEWQATVGNRNGLGSGCPHCYEARHRAFSSV